MPFPAAQIWVVSIANAFLCCKHGGAGSAILVCLSGLDGICSPCPPPPPSPFLAPSGRDGVVVVGCGVGRGEVMRVLAA